MGRSAGTGSPVWFRCGAERQGNYHHRGDSISLTGRTRRYRPPRGSVIGSRSVFTSYEYRCTCGHVGWSNHVDLARLAGDRDALARRGLR